MDTNSKNSSEERFMLRWRGQQDGPYSLATIDRKLANNEIGMLHEVQREGLWITLKSFLEIRVREQKVETERAAQEEQRARQEAEDKIKADESVRQGELLAEERRKNDLLQATINIQNKEAKSAEKHGSSTASKGFGTLLLIGGIIVAAYFFLAFDTSVSTGSGNRVVNLGLMQDRQVGILIGIGMAIVGTLLCVAGSRSKTD